MPWAVASIQYLGHLESDSLLSSLAITSEEQQKKVIENMAKTFLKSMFTYAR